LQRWLGMEEEADMIEATIDLMIEEDMIGEDMIATTIGMIGMIDMIDMTIMTMTAAVPLAEEEGIPLASILGVCQTRLEFETWSKSLAATDTFEIW